MTGLPQQIPQQSVPLLQNPGKKPAYMDVNWYLWAYNISINVLGSGGSGTTPTSPYDSLDAANLISQASDIPQAYRKIDNLTALLGASALPDGADIAKLRHDFSNLYALTSSQILQDSAPQAQPVQTVTVGASPFTYTALTNGLLSVTGGAISSVAIIRQGVTVATGIASGSASDIGSLIDEKGSGGQPGFVAGVDFTGGTTTSLTLSQNYGSASNLWVAFDADEQGANTYSLSGTTLTFTAPIPTGITNVFVKGALPSTVIANGGLIPMRRLDEVKVTYSSAPTIVFLPD